MIRTLNTSNRQRLALAVLFLAGAVYAAIVGMLTPTPNGALLTGLIIEAIAVVFVLTTGPKDDQR